MPAVSDDQLGEMVQARLAVGGDQSTAAVLERLCSAIVELLPITGAGLLLMTLGEHHATLAASDELILTIEELERTMGEGPCLQAYREHAPVLEPDIAGNGVRRWPALAPQALAAGIGAMFSFPLGGVDGYIGALNLHRDQPGALSPPELTRARLLADLAMTIILRLHAQDPLRGLLGDPTGVESSQALLDQAKGITSVHQQVGIDAAYDLLRAHANDHRSPLGQVAADVVAGRLRVT